jgi:hypothetical protein
VVTRDQVREGGRGGSRWRKAAWSLAALLLVTPLVAMQFTDEVRWTASDFAVFGGMLALALGAFELGGRAAGDTVSRFAVAIAVGATFLLVWAQGAVGVAGHPNRPAGLLFTGLVLAVIAGALLVRFRRRG